MKWCVPHNARTLMIDLLCVLNWRRRLQVGYAISVLPQRPDWLEALLTEKFFNPCLKHAASKKNERNIFCVDCNDSICQHCLAAHRTHRLLQVQLPPSFLRYPPSRPVPAQRRALSVCRVWWRLSCRPTCWMEF